MHICLLIVGSVFFSLKSMFDSAEFKLNLSSFQKLIAEGVFDNSYGGFNTDDCRILKKLVLCDLTKSKWVEQHTAFKVCSFNNLSSLFQLCLS